MFCCLIILCSAVVRARPPPRRYTPNGLQERRFSFQDSNDCDTRISFHDASDRDISFIPFHGASDRDRTETVTHYRAYAYIRALLLKLLEFLVSYCIANTSSHHLLHYTDQLILHQTILHYLMLKYLILPYPILLGSWLSLSISSYLSSSSIPYYLKSYYYVTNKPFLPIDLLFLWLLQYLCRTEGWRGQSASQSDRQSVSVNQ